MGSSYIGLSITGNCTVVAQKCPWCLTPEQIGGCSLLFIQVLIEETQGKFELISGEKNLQKLLSSPDTAAHGSGGDTIPSLGRFKSVDVIPGDEGQWWPWLCQGDGWTSRSFPA